MIVVERAQAADAERIRELALQSGIDAWTVAHYQEETVETDRLLLKAIDGSHQILGFISGRLVGSVESELDGEIHGIAVVSKSREQGIGTELFKNAIAWFASRHGNNVWLEVRASNHAAVQFYERMGFLRAAIRKNFYSNPTEDAIVMKLTIKADLRHGID